jgi:copper homeostasis protein (lipoprotein)
MKKMLLIAAVYLFVTSCNTNTNDVVITYDTIDSAALRGDTMAFITEDENYFGTLPCADCSGIITDISFNTGSLTYTIKRNYQGKQNADSTFIENGNLRIQSDSINPNGPTIFVFQSADGSSPSYFVKASDSTLQMLDQNKKQIAGALNYTLVKKKTTE